MEIIGLNSRGAATEDIQRRLEKLGYDIGAEGVDGIYGEKTAAAVAAFRQDRELAPGDFIDSIAWATLVDASFSLGDRILYLRMPFFHGNDVKTLQQILLTLGFSCGPLDSIFGAYTERAVRDFQINMGLEPDGIVGESTERALMRLHHAWGGKDPITDNGATWGFSRAAEVIESTPICIFGTDDVTREIAKAISNLAFATTVSSKIASAQAMSGIPSADMLRIGLISDDKDRESGIPCVVFDGFDSLVKRLATAVAGLGSSSRRIDIKIELSDAASFSGDYEATVADSASDFAMIQHFAVLILDAICRAFS